MGNQLLVVPSSEVVPVLSDHHISIDGLESGDVLQNDSFSNNVTRTEQGREFEVEFWGTFDVTDPSIDLSRTPYLSRTCDFERAVAETIRLQAILGMDPRNPKTKMSLSLFEAVKKKLPNRKRDQLNICCTLRMAWDSKGVDAIFVLANNLRSLFTIDLKLNANPWNWRRKLRADRFITADEMHDPQKVAIIGSIIANQISAAARMGSGKYKWKEKPQRRMPCPMCGR